MTLPASSKCRKHTYLTSSFSVDLPKPICQPTQEQQNNTKTEDSFLFSLPLDGCHLCDCLVHANLISLRFTYTAEAHIM